MSDLSVREAAERARTSDRTVRRWIAEGKLLATRTADGWTVAESDLAPLLDGRTAANGQVDGRPPGRPSVLAEAPLLGQLLADTQAELVRTAAAAAMWQARAEHLQDQLQRALPPPELTESTLAGPPRNGTIETSTEPSESKQRAWWRFWARRTA
jgi:excisionase family DNA binding protein